MTYIMTTGKGGAELEGNSRVWIIGPYRKWDGGIQDRSTKDRV